MIEEIYKDMKASGELFSVLPDALGIWKDDKEIFLEYYNLVNLEFFDVKLAELDDNDYL